MTLNTQNYNCKVSTNVVCGVLERIFYKTIFTEPLFDSDIIADIDYIGKVGNKAFGIQIKPITAQSNFGNYNISERMSKSFKNFEEKYGGKVFVIFSSRVGNRKEIVNKEIISKIEEEINRLENIQ